MNVTLEVWSETVSKSVVSIDYNYSDSLFSGSALNYNYELSKLSSVMAMSAYWDNDHTNKYAKRDLELLGFENIDDCGSYAKLQNMSKDNCDYVGYTFATKNININGKENTIVAVIVKGTSGNEEWYSNFDVGAENYKDGDRHSGFERAKKRMYSDFLQYLSNISDIQSDNVKIWITAHSRGAGVANLFAADITDNSNRSINDVFAYLYAPPAGVVMDGYCDINHDNIFNFINPQDFVPRMPLQSWNYKRYGNDYVFPNEVAYMKDGVIFGGILDFKSDYQNNFVTQFKTLFGGNPESYLFKNGTATTIGICYDFYAIAPSVDKYYNGGFPPYYPYRYFYDGLATAAMGDYSGITIMLSYILDSGNHWFTDLPNRWTNITQYFVFGSAINMTVTYSHTPETYVSWAYLCDSLNDFDYNLFVKGMYACPVDIEVYDSRNNIVGRVVDNKVDESVTILEILVDEETSTKTVFMPVGEKFTVKAIGYDEGTMDCSLEICNITDLSTSDYRSVNDIAITPNTIVTSNTDFSGNMLITAVTDDGDKVTTVEYTIDPETENKDGDDNNENDDNNNDDVDGNENNGNTNNENNFTPSRPSIPSNTSVNNSSNVPANASTQKTISVKVENKITGKSSKAIGTRKNNEVSVKLGTENNGLYANVITDNGDFIEAALIENGKAKFDIPDDVNFRIVIDEFSYVEDVSSGSAVYEENSKVKNGSYVMVIMIVSLFGVGFVAYRKRSYTRK